MFGAQKKDRWMMLWLLQKFAAWPTHLRPLSVESPIVTTLGRQRNIRSSAREKLDATIARSANADLLVLTLVTIWTERTSLTTRSPTIRRFRSQGCVLLSCGPANNRYRRPRDADFLAVEKLPERLSFGSFENSASGWTIRTRWNFAFDPDNEPPSACSGWDMKGV